MDWLEKDLCIKCNEGGNLLVCSENGCPLAVHEGCMGCPARYDDAGQFHCPYCFYKQSVAESRRAREYVLAKKKALLVFLDEKMLGNKKHIEINIRDGNNGSHSSEASGKKVACIDGISNSNGDAIPDQRMQLDEKQSNGVAEEEKVHVAESEGSAGSKGRNLSPKLHEERSISYEGDEEEEKNQEEKQKPNISNEEEEEKNQEEKQKPNISNEDENSYQKKLEGSACCKGRCPSPKFSDGQSITSEEEEEEENQKEKQDISNEEQKRYQEEELSISSEEGQKNREVKHASSSTSSTQVSSAMMNKRLDKNQYKPPTLRSSFKSSSPLKAQKKSNKVIRSSKRLKQSKRSPFKLPIDVFGSPKRRRLMWSDKEEDCLKAGIEMYSKDVINIPWRKILQFGRDVFDETRTPSDLKDKWRNMSK